MTSASGRGPELTREGDEGPSSSDLEGPNRDQMEQQQQQQQQEFRDQDDLMNPDGEEEEEEEQEYAREQQNEQQQDSVPGSQLQSLMASLQVMAGHPMMLQQAAPLASMGAFAGVSSCLSELDLLTLAATGNVVGAGGPSSGDAHLGRAESVAGVSLERSVMVSPGFKSLKQDVGGNQVVAPFGASSAGQHQDVECVGLNSLELDDNTAPEGEVWGSVTCGLLAQSRVVFEAGWMEQVHSGGGGGRGLEHQSDSVVVQLVGLEGPTEGGEVMTGAPVVIESCYVGRQPGVSSVCVVPAVKCFKELWRVSTVVQQRLSEFMGSRPVAPDVLPAVDVHPHAGFLIIVQNARCLHLPPGGAGQWRLQARVQPGSGVAVQLTAI
eukprot:gene5419-5652_t